MRTFPILIFILCLSLPAIAGEDSVEKIVQDYKAIEALLKSGKINQVEHRNALIELQKRAIKKSKCDKYCLEYPYWDPDYPTFLKILSGYRQEPS